MPRLKNTSWDLTPGTSGQFSMEQANLAVLMDIRDELQQLNRVFACPNFQRIPHTLDHIRTNTTRRPYARRKATT